MKYLINKYRLLSTENWEERNTTVTIELDEHGEEIVIKKLKTIEDFAKENDYKIIEVKENLERPISKDDFVNEVFKIELYQKRHDIEDYQEELNNIKIWLQENDWMPNKITTGEWQDTDPRWLAYKQERAVKRARQDELTLLVAE